MKLRRLPSMLMFIPLLLLLSCEEEPTGRTTARFVFYVNGEAGATKDYRRYVIEEEKDEAFDAESVTAFTEAASNGRVVYMSQQGGTFRLYGRCEGGQIIPVPMPVSPDPGEEYALYACPPALSYEGHHAAFMVSRRPVGYPDTASWNQELCIFDCAAWSLTQLPVSSKLKDYFTQQQIDCIPDVVKALRIGISATGDVVFMDLDVSGNDSQRRHHRYSVQMSAYKGSLRVLCMIEIAYPMWFPSRVFDVTTGDLYRATDNVATVIDCRTGAERPSERFLSSWVSYSVASGRTGEVASCNDGSLLSLRRIADGRKTSVIQSINQLQVRYPEVRQMAGIHSERQWCAVSPDGEWLVFIAPHELDDGLFIVRRDGTELRRIARGIFDVPPVVSDVVAY